MKWFKHISDSLDDPFIFDIIEEFGPVGYLVFFGTIEIYAREFKPEKDWFLSISFRLLTQKLQIKRPLRVKKVFLFIQKYNNWHIKYDGKKVHIHIPKFMEFLDDTTLKKLRAIRNKRLLNSGMIPESFPPKDVDVDVDVDVKSKKTPANAAPKKFTPLKKPSEIEKLCQEIEDKKLFPKVRYWKDKMIKDRQNKKAIIHTLKRCLEKENLKDGWAYCNKIIQQENGNYNETESIEQSESFKKQKFPKQFSNLAEGTTKKL
jgi:hypothetical protein